jgi:hypothetical protein
MGLKFKRQKPVGPYIVDFVCFKPALVVEVDGGQHMERAAYDQRRDDFLRKCGFVVLRFWNNQVLEQTEAVLEMIGQVTLSPDPSPASGRGEQNSPLSRKWEGGTGLSPLPLAGEGPGERVLLLHISSVHCPLTSDP